MTDKVKRFCEEYIIDLNGTASAIRAGYSENTAKEQASRLLTNVNVKEKIIKLKEERSKRTLLEADNVLLELAKIGFSDVTDYITIGEKGITFKNIPSDKAGAIAEVSSTETKYGTNIRFKLHDKLSALDKIARHIGGFYKDKETLSSEDKITEIRKTVVTKIVFGSLDDI